MTIIAWQVWIEGKGWIWATPHIAAFVQDAAPHRVKLDDLTVPPTLRFARWPKFVDTRSRARRLVNAERALARQRDKVALFADHLAAEQPTPEERVDGFDRMCSDLEAEQRRTEAGYRREARRLVRAMPHDKRCEIMCSFANAFRRDGHYALYLIRNGGAA